MWREDNFTESPLNMDKWLSLSSQNLIPENPRVLRKGKSDSRTHTFCIASFGLLPSCLLHTGESVPENTKIQSSVHKTNNGVSICSGDLSTLHLLRLTLLHMCAIYTSSVAWLLIKIKFTWTLQIKHAFTVPYKGIFIFLIIIYFIFILYTIT